MPRLRLPGLPGLARLRLRRVWRLLCKVGSVPLVLSSAS